MLKNNLMYVSSMFCSHPRGRPNYPPLNAQWASCFNTITGKTIRKKDGAHVCRGGLGGPPLTDPWKQQRCSSKTALGWLSLPHKHVSAKPLRVWQESAAAGVPPERSADLLSCVRGSVESHSKRRVIVVLTALCWGPIPGVHASPVCGGIIQSLLWAPRSEGNAKGRPLKKKKWWKQHEGLKHAVMFDCHFWTFKMNFSFSFSDFIN